MPCAIGASSSAKESWWKSLRLLDLYWMAVEKLLLRLARGAVHVAVFALFRIFPGI